MPSLFEILVLGETLKMWKTYRETDTDTQMHSQTHREQDKQTIRKFHANFQLRWAKNVLACMITSKQKLKML